MHLETILYNSRSSPDVETSDFFWKTCHSILTLISPSWRFCCQILSNTLQFYILPKQQTSIKWQSQSSLIFSSLSSSISQFLQWAMDPLLGPIKMGQNDWSGINLLHYPQYMRYVLQMNRQLAPVFSHVPYGLMAF